MRPGPNPSFVRRLRWLIPVGVVSLVLVVLVARPVLTRWSEPPALAPPTYVEQATAAGINHAYTGDFTYFVGGGVAVFDCNADLKQDLYVAGGSSAAALYRNDSLIGGALAFARVVDPITDQTSVVGAYPLDVDSDGLMDLAVLRLGENVLLRGRGNCQFERANEMWNFDGGDAWTTSFSAKWEADATLPTMAFGNYLNVDAAGRQLEGCPDNELFRPMIADTYGPPIPLSPGWCTLSILFSDWDRSGKSDLRVTNDRHYYRDGEEQLWHINMGRDPELYTVDDGWPRLQINGMGIATYDVSGDGFPEFFLTNMGDNKLQTLAEDASEPLFYDIAFGSGVTAHRPFVGDATLPSTAWHAEFQDVNNDGFIDLFVTKGNVDEMPDFAALDPDNLLIGQPDGTFIEGADTAGLMSTGRSRGAGVADFNLDGMLDVIEVNRKENVKLWRNVGWGDESSSRPMGNWVAVQLLQDAPNRDGIGSWIEIKLGDRTIWREVTVGGGHASGQIGPVHLGIGNERRVEIRVQWPDGAVGDWIELSAGTSVIIDRGASEARIVHPPEE